MAKAPTPTRAVVIVVSVCRLIRAPPGRLKQVKCAPRCHACAKQKTVVLEAPHAYRRCITIVPTDTTKMAMTINPHVDAAGTGMVHSWTVSHHAFHPSFKRDLPQTFVTVDLPEGVRLLAPLRGDATGLEIGRAVTIGVEALDDNWSIPVVRLA